MLTQTRLQDKVFKLIDKERFDDALSLVEIERLYAKKEPFYYCLYGIIHIYVGKFGDAKVFINKALELNQFHDSSLNALAYIKLSEGNVREAIELYVQILDLNPDNSLVKTNLNRFKGRQEVNSILKDISPNSYLREGNPNLFKYHKVLSALLLICLIGVLYFSLKDYNFSKERANGEAEEQTNEQLKKHTTYRKERLKYKAISYFPPEELHSLLESLKANSAIEDTLINLNDILSSNLDINEKIELEHSMRDIIFNYSKYEEHSLSYPRVKDLFSKAYKYDGSKVILNGNVAKEGNTEYLISTLEGNNFSLHDTKKLIPINKINKPIKLLIQINSSKKAKPYAIVLSILN